LTLFARTGVVMLTELNTRQAGTWQPTHEPVPTDFRLLMVSVNEKYSVPPSRSWSASGATALAAMTRAVFGPRWPMLYAPIRPSHPYLEPRQQPPGAPSQGQRRTARAGVLELPPAGSVAPAAARSTTTSLPDVWPDQRASVTATSVPPVSVFERRQSSC
jgi:hypothetical protein